ncbi:MAG: site-specific integrase [Planctomycetota bacterium]
MPKPSTRLSPLRLNKQSWVTGWYDHSGRRRWRSFGNAKKVGKREAERLYTEFADQWYNDRTVRNKDEDGPSEIAVKELYERYKAYAEREYKTQGGGRSNHAVNMDYAFREMVAVCGHKLVSQVLASDLRQARERMLDRDLSRGTINERVNRIRHVFKWGVGHDLVPPEVLQKLQAVEPLRMGRSGVKEGKGRRTLHRSAVDAVLPHLPRPVAGMVELQWLTGMRPGEVMSMRGCDIDMTNDVRVYEPVHHKTKHYGKTRKVYLGAKAQAVVEPFLKRGLDECLFSPRDAIVDREANRPGDAKRSRSSYKQHGERYEASSYRNAVHRACKAAGVDPWTPYDLRHTAASRLRRDHG